MDPGVDRGGIAVKGGAQIGNGEAWRGDLKQRRSNAMPRNAKMWQGYATNGDETAKLCAELCCGGIAPHGSEMRRLGDAVNGDATEKLCAEFCC